MADGATAAGDIDRILIQFHDTTYAQWYGCKCFIDFPQADIFQCRTSARQQFFNDGRDRKTGFRRLDTNRCPANDFCQHLAAMNLGDVTRGDYQRSCRIVAAAGIACGDGEALYFRMQYRK